MRYRLLVAVGVSAAVMSGALVATARLDAQGLGSKTTSAAKAARTPDGQPDLQGVWTFATVTPLERPKEFEGKEFLTEQEAAAFEQRAARDVDQREESSLGTAADVGAAYNQFWWDRGTKVVETRRTSLIVDPADGKLPPMSAEGQQRAERAGRRVNPPAGPEDRGLWERCITHSAIPRMSTGYNNNLQIFQGSGYVAIVYEMIHEVRIIPLDARPHVAKGIRQWLGDSRGRWEGDTLVVETTNFSDKTSFRGASENLRLVERFSRLDADTLDYQFTVDDASTWAKPWTASLPMPRVDNLMFEYACHEGNYGLVGQLSGARAEEKAAAEAARKGSK
ncbi:MAG: hypothetical protein GEU82_01775 [Luteitalea sp.]|nr:hypothetical protein [Luteitalea sp.]